MQAERTTPSAGDGAHARAPSPARDPLDAAIERYADSLAAYVQALALTAALSALQAVA